MRYKVDATTGLEYYLLYTALQVHSNDYGSANQNVVRLVRSGPTEDGRVLSVKETKNTLNGGPCGSSCGVDGSLENGRIDALASFEDVDVLVAVSRMSDPT